MCSPLNCIFFDERKSLAPLMSVLPSGTHYSAVLTRIMLIRYLVQGINILIQPMIEPTFSVFRYRLSDFVTKMPLILDTVERRVANALKFCAEGTQFDKCAMYLSNTLSTFASIDSANNEYQCC